MFLFVCCLSATAQIRLEKLILSKGEKYSIENTDIIVVDSLIMADSAEIILNHAKRDNFIHAKIAIIGNGCVIKGAGTMGANGTNGTNGEEQSSPCRQGGVGGDGEMGNDGSNGINLFIYSDDIQLNGSLTINLNGGDGGNGGSGGHGGGGGQGTRVCTGGDGGQGGSGSRGGHGAAGGNLTVQCKRCPDYVYWLGSRLFIKNYGGYGGLGGEAGRGGLAGLGPVRDGKNGQRGYRAEEGISGKTGIIIWNKK